MAYGLVVLLGIGVPVVWILIFHNWLEDWNHQFWGFVITWIPPALYLICIFLYFWGKGVGLIN